ncbi:MAG: hypothetical protein FWH28_06760 [Clostridiales bacterium]|nr:hypothetical protein [Clostridiales bacterium]
MSLRLRVHYDEGDEFQRLIDILEPFLTNMGKIYFDANKERFRTYLTLDFTINEDQGQRHLHRNDDSHEDKEDK